MERPQTFANTWLVLHTLGFILALEGVAEYFSNRHYQGVFHRLILLAFQHYSGRDDDPTRPRLPESWEEWYNS